MTTDNITTIRIGDWIACEGKIGRVKEILTDVEGHPYLTESGLRFATDSQKIHGEYDLP